MRLVGEHIASTALRQDPAMSAAKAKEGVFDMEAEEKEISSMMQQVHGPTNPETAAKPLKADKKNKRRK